MICIAIAQKSQPLVLFDLYNAAPQCDLVEVRLDCFEEPPDLAQLLQYKRKPIILTCRRAEDGGEWMGQESQRLALLRQAAAAGADFVEVELDVADQVPVKPPTRRVVSYTNLMETPDNLADVYKRIVATRPDVAKIVIPARSPEEAWPAVQILAKPAVPTVVVGVGKPGVMLSLLAARMGAPWVYGALERGTESYHNQFTVRELEEVYHYRAITRSTPFAAVAGFDEPSFINVALLNAAFAHLNEPVRCLPVQIGDLPLFRRVLEVVKAGHAIIDPPHQAGVQAIVAEVKPSARVANAVDFMALEDGQWQGYNLLHRSVLASLDAALRAAGAGDTPFQGRTILFLGANGLTRVLAATLQKAAAVPLVASARAFSARELAESLGGQSVEADALAASPHDVLIRTDAAEPIPESFRPGVVVADLTALSRWSPFLLKASGQGCPLVDPTHVMAELVNRQARAIVGKTIPRAALLEKLAPFLEDA